MEATTATLTLDCWVGNGLVGKGDGETKVVVAVVSNKDDGCS